MNEDSKPVLTPEENHDHSISEMHQKDCGVDRLILEREIKAFGHQIFQHLEREKPSILRAKFWTSKIMQWSMQFQRFKTDMFRLVDVLPSLATDRSIAAHVSEYLEASAREIHGILGWGVKVRPNSLRGKIVAIAVRKSVGQMAKQFIAGATPREAIQELKRLREARLAFTVDLLGEYCVSEGEALDYFRRYQEAMEVFGETVPHWSSAESIIAHHPGEQTPMCVSIKLSALYSQCYALNFTKSVDVLTERLSALVRIAREKHIQVYCDAEDTGHNPIIYAVFRNVFGSAEFRSYPYPGIVIQAYARDSFQLAENMLSFAHERGSPIAVRLVKGAYWDSETVSCSQKNWDNPLFTRKADSDANFERIAELLLDNTDVCLPAFGSHNIRSLAHACTYAKLRGLTTTQYELQMLYGMAEPIAKTFQRSGHLVRLYVPLGELIPGMGYLVRRLLENTSNESFLRHTFFDKRGIDILLQAPTDSYQQGDTPCQ
jgi:RHH-type proline utilization regulon transcriptional repressor/proline dehydrogenase/delta 1-pyrroline-5-carboxylate dehydrogenase